MRKIVIVGGGLVGSLLAIMLKKRNYQVTIFEKRPDMRKQILDGGRSINLVITSRGLHALKKVGLVEEVLKICSPVQGRKIHPLGKSQEKDWLFQPYGRDPSECNYSVSRADLNRFLLTSCENRGVEIVFQHHLVEADFSAQKGVCSAPKGEKTFSYDVLIGTDGAGSVLRDQMQTHLGQQYQQSTDYLPVDYKELLMPLRGGQPQLDTKALHIWPRGQRMLMALPNLNGSFTMTLYLAREGASKSFSALKTAQDIEDFFQQDFSDALERIPNCAQQFLQNPQGKLGTVRSSPWVYQDSVALLGDAAHAIVPFFGQGMNLGFEDCVYLISFLEKHKDDWDKALSEYNQFQKPNADAIADMAIENFTEMSDKVGDEKFLLMKRVEAIIENEMPQIYRSRYGMITYTLIPYALCLEAGKIQARILSELCQGLQSEKSLDLSYARRVVEKEFLPFLQKHQLNITRFKIT